MGFFSFRQELAIDLGTANTIIISDDKIVVDEPSVVALDRRTDKMIAVGEEAKMMHEKTHENIRTIRPLRDGVIADFSACEQMMRGLIRMVHTGRHFFSPTLRMVIGVPSGSTEVEIRAVRDSAEHAEGRDVYLIKEPMAAAIGIGIDVMKPEGNMIVDIGGGTTEIAVISLGGIPCNNSIRIAGDDLTADIQEYMARQHNVIHMPSLPRNVLNPLSALTPAPVRNTICCRVISLHFVWAVVKLHRCEGFVIIAEFRILLEDFFYFVSDFPVLQLLYLHLLLLRCKRTNLTCFYSMSHIDSYVELSISKLTILVYNRVISPSYSNLCRSSNLELASFFLTVKGQYLMIQPYALFFGARIRKGNDTSTDKTC